MVSSNDYSAFGVLLKDRSFASESYSYAFNGKESDNEVKGTKNSYDFGDRMYDPRIGKWLSMDHLAAKFSDISPYVHSLNNPLFFIDPDGNDVTVYITRNKVGTTKINLYSADEIAKNSNLKNKTKIVPVYEVNVTNEYGCTSTFYFTRYALRGNHKKPNDAPTETTFEVTNDEHKFLGKIKSRWGVKDYVLELRDINDVNNQSVKGKKGDKKQKRQAIQLHVKGASDGCLLCVGKDQFETKEKNIDETNLKKGSSDTQKEFINIIKDFLIWDNLIGKGQDILIKFDQINSDLDSKKPPSVDSSLPGINGGGGPNKGGSSGGNNGGPSFY